MSKLRPDLQIIADNILPGSRVLDIGCGDGALMAALRDDKNCDARGLEINPINVASAVAKVSESIHFRAWFPTLRSPNHYATANLGHVGGKLEVKVRVQDCHVVVVQGKVLSHSVQATKP